MRMKLQSILLGLLLIGGTASAQTADPVVMTVGGQPVTRSEFEYSYNKNNSEGVIDKKSVNEYVDLFVNYKLKVRAAEDAHLDTLSSFKKEFETYRDQQIRPTFVTSDDVEAKARQIYEQTRHEVDSLGGMVKVSHILIGLGQRASESQQDSAKALANDVYGQLQKGADFAEMARKYSADRGSAAEGGQLPWITKGQTVKEFEDVAFALKKGETSRPVQSPFGYHIIKVDDKGGFFPYDSVHASILRFIEARGLREQIVNEKLDSIVKARGNGTTREDILNAEATRLSAKDSNLKYLIQEYHDGLLLYEISNRLVWDKAAKDTLGQERFFASHKKNYKWDQPRFKGIAYCTRDKADIEAVKKSVKGKPFGQWADILRQTFNNDSVLRIRVEKGIFKEGDNALVDKEIFGKDTVATPLKGYPYQAVYGKKLKKSPEDYTDVRSQVVTDYQDALEKEWVATLRKKYNVSVNRDVLATVNKH